MRSEEDETSEIRREVSLERIISELRSLKESATSLSDISEKINKQIVTQNELLKEFTFLREQLSVLKEQISNGRALHDLRISRLEDDTKAVKILLDENRMSIWKLLGASAGSGAIITGIIEVLKTVGK